MAGHRVVCMDLEELELRDMAKDALRHPDPPKCALCDEQIEVSDACPLMKCQNCGPVCWQCRQNVDPCRPGDEQVCCGCGAAVEEDAP